MALIELKGKITKVHPSFLLVREAHSKKDPNNNWYVASYSVYQVWIPQEQRSQTWEVDDYVDVVGRFKTETYERDGKSYENMVISATKLEKSESPFAKKAPQPVQVADAVGDELPF